MIVKTKTAQTANNKYEQAGVAAEEQMAFYLRRAFGDEADVFVLNDLRLVGDDDAAQIDHLVLHPFGIFIVESKSVSGEVTVDKHGEWIREWGGNRQGMKSPIQQAKLQAEFLRKLLNRHKEQLRDKRIFGKIQPGFGHCPIDLCIAISDKGIINRKGFESPELCKADQVCDRLQAEIKRHRRASGLIAKMDGDYGMWSLRPGEMSRIVEFLLGQHAPLKLEVEREPAPAVAPPPPPDRSRKPAVKPVEVDRPEAVVCKHCGSGDLTATYGKYGYYFKCRACDENMPIDNICRSCNKKGRISKSGSRFHRVCEACGAEQLVHVNPA